MSWVHDIIAWWPDASNMQQQTWTQNQLDMEKRIQCMWGHACMCLQMHDMHAWMCMHAHSWIYVKFHLKPKARWWASPLYIFWTSSEDRFTFVTYLRILRETPTHGLQSCHICMYAWSCVIKHQTSSRQNPSSAWQFLSPQEPENICMCTFMRFAKFAQLSWNQGPNHSSISSLLCSFIYMHAVVWRMYLKCVRSSVGSACSAASAPCLWNACMFVTACMCLCTCVLNEDWLQHAWAQHQPRGGTFRLFIIIRVSSAPFFQRPCPTP